LRSFEQVYSTLQSLVPSLSSTQCAHSWTVWTEWHSPLGTS